MSADNKRIVFLAMVQTLIERSEKVGKVTNDEGSTRYTIDKARQEQAQAKAAMLKWFAQEHGGYFENIEVGPAPTFGDLCDAVEAVRRQKAEASL